MKKLLYFFGISLFALSCNNKDGKSGTDAADNSKTATAKIEYPYTLDRPYQNWQAGDQQNAVNVLKMIKAWETHNLKECATYFGDSVDMRLDSYQQKLSHDSLPSMLDGSWANYASVKIKMEDWEPVISSDKKEEWVTIWYKENWIDKTGKADSLNVINDAKMVKGKIVVFDEKIQHFAPPKK